MGDFVDHDLDWGEDAGYEVDEEVTCKRCKKGGLTWYDIGTRAHPEWRLFEVLRNGQLTPHRCQEQDHSNAFEDES